MSALTQRSAVDLARRVMRERDELRARLRRREGAYSELLDQVTNFRELLRARATSDGKPECEDCGGTGGEVIGYDKIAANGFEIECFVVEGYEDPNDLPCENCLGVGRDWI